RKRLFRCDAGTLFAWIGPTIEEARGLGMEPLMESKKPWHDTETAGTLARAGNESMPPATGTPSSGSVTALVVLITIGVLYVGREMFMPVALAILLSFMMAPLVEALRRWYVPRVPAVIMVVTLAIALVGALSILVGNQLVNIA